MKELTKIAALICIFTSAIILPNITTIKSLYTCAHPELVEGYPQAQQKIKKTMYYHDIMIYFHSIKRLSSSIYFLSYLYKHNYCYKPCNIIEFTDFIYIDSIIFSHDKIQACLHSMVQQQSLKPFLILLQKVRHYYYLHDNLFMYEFFLLLFIIHKQIILNECEENSHILTKATLNTIIEVSEKINQLPIAEVLNVIDMLVRELPPFLEKYELQSKITWRAWLTKYWWVPPIFSAWFGLKILLSLQRPYLYYSPYLSPRPQISLQPLITNDPALLEIRKEK